MVFELANGNVDLILLEQIMRHIVKETAHFREYAVQGHEHSRLIDFEELDDERWGVLIGADNLVELLPLLEANQERIGRIHIQGRLIDRWNGYYDVHRNPWGARFRPV